MPTKTKTTPDSLIAAHFTLPANIEFYSNAANSDLYNGPRDSYEDDPFPYLGFSHAVKIVGDWADRELPSEIWVDMDCGEVINGCPEEGYTNEETGEYIENCLDHIYHSESRDILRAIFGKELASYL